MIAAVLFDFDFTLADSSAGAIECANYALRRMGLPPAEPERIRETIGLSLASGFERLVGGDGGAGAEEYARLFVERADSVMVELTWIYDEVPEVVRRLRTSGAKLGIVSTKFRHRIQAILERRGLEDAFDLIVGGEDTPRHKPHPEALHLARDRLGPERAPDAYVGDHPVDAEAAARAELPFVATLTGTHGAEAFAGFDTLAIIPDLSALPAVLDAHAATRPERGRP